MSDRDKQGYSNPSEFKDKYDEIYSVGENVSSGVTMEAHVVANWQWSPGHNTIMSEEELTHLRIGFNVKNGYWTQLFGEDKKEETQEIKTTFLKEDNKQEVSNKEPKKKDKQEPVETKEEAETPVMQEESDE